MNKKITKLAGAVVFLILINIGLFSLAAIKLTSFWISWIFIHIAFLIFAGILIFSAPEQRKLKFAYSETAVAAYYFIIELIAGYVLLTYFVFIPVISFVIQTVILAVFLIAFFMLKGMNRDIDRKEDAAKADLRQFQAILEFMKDVQSQVDYSAPYKKTIQHAYDAISGSQVKSSPAVYEMEKNIWDLIGQLKKEVAAENEERINALCRDIENQTAERNRRLRMER
ncbi:MAG: hypothetical protein HFI20_00805 [Lachnospiraceae bacterium]|jgi:amino acid permease|nr:hypothetical protein [Lachnospiraceae bacterium]MCI9307214.1 hypothetical protein [Lachnospiraceae bacterium]